MNSALELHDSVIDSIIVETSIVRILFSSAYVHQSTGNPGIDAGLGFRQPAELILSGTTVTDTKLDYKGIISDASIESENESFSLLSLPFSLSGALTASFVLASGVSFSILASDIKCAVSVSPTYVEAFGAN